MSQGGHGIVDFCAISWNNRPNNSEGGLLSVLFMRSNGLFYCVYVPARINVPRLTVYYGQPRHINWSTLK